MLNIDTFNNPSIKLQAIPYYADCYNFWDLNRCVESFTSDEYDEIISRTLIRNQIPWNETLMVMDFNEYDWCGKHYEENLSKNVRRDISQCFKKGFQFKEYNFNSFIYDFLEINYSQSDLKGGINSWYLNDFSFFDGSHSGYQHEWEDSAHYSKWYGIFKYLKHYKQGDVQTSEKLYAYCKVLVDGEMACIGLTWCHAKHMKQGLMFSLITSIAKMLMETEGVKCLVYSGGMARWKKRMLFRQMAVNIK
jgi:hypothetical protein